MAYIGIQPAEKFTSFATQTFSVSATTSYTLDHAVANENELALFVNNVRQQPGSGKAYTATGTALTLSAATASTDTMYCVFLGRALQTVTPATNTVTSSMLGGTFFTGATDIGADIADADLFLLDDGAGGTIRKSAASRIKTYIGGGITVAGMFRLSTSITGDQSPISSNLEEVDTDGYARIGSAMTESSGIFTFPSTGIYLIQVQASFQTESGQSSNYHTVQLQTTTNNSSYSPAAVGWAGGVDATEYSGTFAQHIFDVTDVSTHKARFTIDTNHSTSYILGNTNETYTGFTFIRLGDT